MSNQTYDKWTCANILDDVEFNLEEAKQFKDLLNEKEGETQEGSSALLTVGQILTGSIVEITKDFAIVDVGLKSEGLVSLSEFQDPQEVFLGNDIEVLLEKAEGSDGQIVLSRERARKLRQWEHIVSNCKEGSIVNGRVIRKVKGGLMVDIGMEAFLPGSQIDNKRIKNLDEYIGKRFDFKILKINLERKNIVISRREILEEERMSKKIELLDKIKVGDLRTGVVKNITDFGVFLDLDGLDGLLHITDMTWKRIKHPSEMVELGQELEIMILNIDHEKGRVALGLKQKEENPWEEVEKRFPEGTRVHGKIVNLVSYGAFIEIEKGLEGLIHVSEMSWTKNVTDPSQVVAIGQEVDAIVLSVQKDEGKISLGMKQTERNPWEEVADKYPIGKVVNATVKNLTNYGAFVELEPGIEALVHISDLSWTKKVSHPSEVLNKGDELEAIILTVDRESKKITLGIKQLLDNPWETIEKTMPIGAIVKGEVLKTAAFGAFILLENGLEGLIHVTELSDQSFSKVEDVIKKGDHIQARVLKIDPEHKKIALSIKEFTSDIKGENIDEIVVEKEEKSDEDN